MRETLLQFLLAERIDPDELVAACAVDNMSRVRSIIEHVREDSVLQLVYRAAVCTVTEGSEVSSRTEAASWYGALRPDPLLAETALSVA